VKALSVRQPWAWLILHGGKDVENRTWRASYRGPVLIHASGNMGPRDYAAGRDFAEGLGVDVPAPTVLKRGGIVGAAVLTGVTEPGGRAGPWHFEDQFGILLGRRVALPFRPVLGRLFFFEVEITDGEREILIGAGVLDGTRRNP